MLSLAGVETDAEAEGAAPPLSEGEPPPPPVDAEWAAPPEGPAPETIASSDRPELGRRKRGVTLATRREVRWEWSPGVWNWKERRCEGTAEPTRGARGERGETDLRNFSFLF